MKKPRNTPSGKAPVRPVQPKESSVARVLPDKPGEPGTSNPSILEEAAQIIAGPRRDAYGPAEASFARLARVLTVAFHRKLKEPLNAHDAAMVGIALKFCRESVKHNRDNLVDLAGYAALADMVSATDPYYAAFSNEP